MEHCFVYGREGNTRLLVGFQIKGSWSSKRGAADNVNPYSHNSVFTNYCVTLCGPMPPR